MGKVTHIISDKDGTIVGYKIMCPACKWTHLFDKRWSFNGRFDKPTFKPSMLVNKDSSNKAVPKCHSYVTDGEIQFLSDCTHDMKGKTVELEEF